MIDVIASFFPEGITHYLIGGIFIGVGVALIYLLTSRIPGASTPLEAGLSYVSKVEHFQQYRSSRDWRMVFVFGIVLGAAIYALLFQSTIWTTDVQWWRLLGGGILIGIGTRLGKGCTSGHGICGIASRSGTSILNVATFMAVAIATALIVSSLGVSP